MDPVLPTNLIGVWRARDLSFLKVAGWQDMMLTITPDATFVMAGANPYGPGGRLDIRGTVSLGREATPRQIDLTIADSNNQIFFKTGQGMPGLFELSGAGELTIIWGTTQFSIPRPAATTGGAVFVKG